MSFRWRYASSPLTDSPRTRNPRPKPLRTLSVQELQHRGYEVTVEKLRGLSKRLHVEILDCAPHGKRSFFKVRARQHAGGLGRVRAACARPHAGGL